MVEATAGSLVYVSIWLNTFNRRYRLNVRQGRLAEVPLMKYSLIGILGSTAQPRPYTAGCLM